MNTWKLATIGLALTGVTATTAGLTTAYFMRPVLAPGPDSATGFVSAADASTFAQPRLQPAVYRPSTRPAATPVSTAAALAPVPAAPQRVAAAPVPATAESCETGGDRAWRIAKPGLVGTLVGAGLGAAGGALADGGKGAGKGAVVGGIAGAAVGTGYGAYKTRNECGTIFGQAAGLTDAAPHATSPVLARGDAPLAARANDRIKIYRAR